MPRACGSLCRTGAQRGGQAEKVGLALPSANLRSRLTWAALQHPGPRPAPGGGGCLPVSADEVSGAPSPDPAPAQMGRWPDVLG